jgi:general secretion pathway protein G
LRPLAHSRASPRALVVPSLRIDRPRAQARVLRRIATHPRPQPVMSATARSTQRARDAARRIERGFTMIELMMALAVLAILVVIGNSQYQQYMDRVRITRAVMDIGAIEGWIGHYEEVNRALPQTLDDLKVALPLDPWGNPYQYLNHQTAKGKGGFRKDKHIVPINTDYDLYSMGKDGASVAPLTATASRDDIVRANDGRFIGLASDYDP